ncbi:helix-turn-helix domain-containing protein [Vallitalea guaymasensis]|uniref:helix-turn-helix domain-containing protein n=1 Tax=Vallitalea guaymasensis TaxID=1185412 RepID=UPI000DE51B7F|nr:helix-turn-helix transcriptional regulator [Vallitalea guaymasensis]
MYKNCIMKYLLEKKKSQLQLARETKIAPSDLNNVIKGKRYCYPGWRKRISQALDVKEEDLFKGEV